MRRTLSLAVSLLLVAVLTSCSDAAPQAEGTVTTAGTTTTLPTTEPPPQLPRGGGRELFPERRVIAFYGNSGTATLGVLGETAPEEAAARIEAAAAPFETPGRPVLPAFELIVTVAQADPGDDGDYSAPTDLDVVRRWHDAARAAGMLLILDIQPGRAPFLPEVQRYEELLREPDVGLALDSEWRMGPDEVPGEVIGSVDAAEINEVSAWLTGLMSEGDLPEKVFLLHLFTDSMIRDRAQVKERPGLATVFHVDGFGGQEVKVQKYEALKGTFPFASGFKLFYDEDIDMFTPEELLAVDPDIDLVTYQ